MITNTGKSIIGKYLIGNAPSYASYIAVGCGPKALSSIESVGDYSNKTSLDLEMFRVPIISRGFISEDQLDENGDIVIDNDGNPVKISQVVLTAELPTEERYEITEVGIFSAGSNITAGANGSRTVLSFSNAEGWTANNSSITMINSPLDNLDVPDNIIRDELGSFFQANSDNRIFTNSGRYDEGERGRFLNNMVLVAGDTSEIEDIDGVLSLATGATNIPIRLSNTSVSLSKNSPTDELTLGFSVIRRDGQTSDIPDVVRVIVEFSNGSNSNPQSAQMQIILDDIEDDSIDFSTYRYFAITKKLSELIQTSEFSWTSVNTINIYTSVIADNGDSDLTNDYSDNFFVAFDVLRLENKTDINPLYGMTGYSIVKTPLGDPIIKSPNTSGFIEFRFVMDVS